jgi:hypothetical protein
MHSGGAVEKAITELKFIIPEEILDLVFLKKAYFYRDRPTNLDREIIKKVIAPRVMVDCSLIGGTDYIVPLMDIYREMTEEWMAIYRIPKEFTDNRSIMSILGIMYINPYMVSAEAGNSTCGWSHIMATTQAVLDAMAPVPNFASSDVQLEGENVIVIRDARVLPVFSYARVLLSYDEYMSNITPRSYIAFAKMCELAVKSYIWKNRVIPLDRGELTAGVTLGAIKEVIDEYKDAEQMYQDYRKDVMRKVLMLNDPQRRRRHLTRLVGGYK